MLLMMVLDKINVSLELISEKYKHWIDHLNLNWIVITIHSAKTLILIAILKNLCPTLVNNTITNSKKLRVFFLDSFVGVLIFSLQFRADDYPGKKLDLAHG